MRDLLMTLATLATLVFPFVAMPLLWRRMKRVRDTEYRARAATPVRAPWQEPLEQEAGLTLARSHDPADELIAMGDKARHSRWPLDSQ